MRQLTLPIQFERPAHLDGFFTSPANEPMLRGLYAFIDPGFEQSQVTVGEVFFLWGGVGVGKTHLALGLCQHAHNLGFRTGFLDLMDLHRFGRTALADLERLDFLCWDNLNALEGLQNQRGFWEEELLHAFNRLRDSGVKLLITSDKPPAALDIQLADLKSRLNWGHCYRVFELTDEDKVQAIIALAHYRGMQIAEPVAQYIVRRVQRRMDTLESLIGVLDETSLSQQRKITIPFVKDCLSW